MRVIAAVLIVCLVAVEGRRIVHRSLAPLATEFLENPKGSKGEDASLPSLPQAVVAPVVTPVDGGAVPIGVSITLPSPPPYIPDPPEPVVAGCTGDDCSTTRALLARNKIIQLDGRIAAKKAVLDAHDDWLSDARNAADRLTKQIGEVEEQRANVQDELDTLQLQRADLDKGMKRDLLEAELERAQANLRDVTRQTDQLGAAHRAIDARAKKLEQNMLGLGKQLDWDSSDVEKKLQEFEDANSALANIGDEANPDDQTQDITATPTDEAAEDEAAAEEESAENADEDAEADAAEEK